MFRNLRDLIGSFPKMPARQEKKVQTFELLFSRERVLGRLYIFHFFKLRMLRDHVAHEKYVCEGIYSEWKSTFRRAIKNITLFFIFVNEEIKLERF